MDIRSLLRVAVSVATLEIRRTTARSEHSDALGDILNWQMDLGCDGWTRDRPPQYCLHDIMQTPFERCSAPRPTQPRIQDYSFPLFEFDIRTLSIKRNYHRVCIRAPGLTLWIKQEADSLPRAASNFLDMQHKRPPNSNSRIRASSF